MEVAAGDVAEMLNSHSQLLNKKQVVVEQSLNVMNNSSLEYAITLIASTLSQNHANSYEFT